MVGKIPKIRIEQKQREAACGAQSGFAGRNAKMRDSGVGLGRPVNVRDM
jgi:hypothetical protein